MAMYYQGSSEIPADGLQTLYLMNPNNYVGYSDTQHQSATNMFFNDNSAAAATPVPHAPLPQAQQCVGIPISYDPNRPSPLGQQEEIHACHNTIPRFHYNLWSSVDQSATGNQPNLPQQTSNGLSLCLSPYQASFINNKSVHGYQDFPGQSSIGMISPKNSSYPSGLSALSNGVNTVQSVIMGSKYLEAAKQLLDEVASVGKGIEYDRPEESNDKAKKIKESMALNAKASSGVGESGGKGGGAELTITQRQEIQTKKAKLVSMLAEVEQRYRQYHHQMQIVMASFEQAAGIDSAKSYTNLALNTILKQFRSLKDAISAQIKALSKTLGEEQSLGEKSEGSKLKLVDHELRQQKTLQQLGMMQNNAWRPHRGLPERAVSVLRAWLFEHFLHPYPKDSDKQMLAKQTGLTRSQVSNWFINARVRLWKPMVEEMYLEEIKNQDQANSDENYTSCWNGPEKQLGSKSTYKQEKTTAITDQLITLQSKPQNLPVPSPAKILASTVVTTSPTAAPPAGFAQLIASLNMKNIAEKNPKKPRNYHDRTYYNSPISILSNEMEMKDSRKGFINKNFSHDEQNYGTGLGNEIGELGKYNAQQLATGRFHGNNNNNNNVSLTLALPPSQSSPLSAGSQQQKFLSSTNFEFGTRIETGVHDSSSRVNGLQVSNVGYEILDFQNRKTFPARLLPDFVA